jgi:hypothetical protein
VLKNIKKSHEKVWKIRKKRYLCTRNQKNSDVKKIAAKVLKRGLKKKFTKNLVV